MTIDCSTLQNGDVCICYIEYKDQGEKECTFIGKNPWPKDEYQEYVFCHSNAKGEIFTVNEKGFARPFHETDYYAHNPYVLRKKPLGAKFVGWMNIYPNRKSGIWYESEKEADYAADSNRLACIKVEKDYELGEGLK